MGRKMYVMNGGKLGRKIGTTENRSDFLNKEKTQKIVSLLEKGKSVRDISGRLGVSTKTVVKVRKYSEIQKVVGCSPKTIKKVKVLMKDTTNI